MRGSPHTYPLSLRFVGRILQVGRAIDARVQQEVPHCRPAHPYQSAESQSQIAPIVVQLGSEKFKSPVNVVASGIRCLYHILKPLLWCSGVGRIAGRCVVAAPSDTALTFSPSI